MSDRRPAPTAECRARTDNAGDDPGRDPVPDEFAPYVWSASIAEVAARHGLAPAQVLKFDQNTPPLPGVPQVPLAESFATLNEYPTGATASCARRPQATCRGRRPSMSTGSRSSSARAPTTSSCSARARTSARAQRLDRDPDVLDVPDRDPAQRRASRRPRTRARPALALQPGQPDRARSRLRQIWSSSHGGTRARRSSSTRPTSSTAARSVVPGSTSART